jgi:hypothetical protein
MKVIFLLAALFCLNTSYSQARMGSSISEIQEEFQSDPTFISGFPDSPWLSVELSTATVFYTFDARGNCEQTIISPTTTYDLNYYLNRYNAEYKKTSESAWVIVEDGYNIYISLKMTDDGVYFFTWTF